MTREPVFDNEPGGVTVRDLQGGIVPIQTPKGFSVPAFRNILSAAYTAFMAKGKIPTPEDMHDVWGRIAVSTYAEAVVTDEFKRAMAIRGVEWDDNSGLTYEQSLTIDVLSNPGDRRSTSVKIKELGVSPVTLAAWRKNPLFMKIMSQRSEHNLQEHLPDIVNTLVGAAQGGNMQAIDRVLAMTGRYDPQNREVLVLREMIQHLLRIISMRIPDAELRSQIASDIENAAGSVLTLGSPDETR